MLSEKSAVMAVGLGCRFDLAIVGLIGVSGPGHAGLGRDADTIN
jgi:hypothetical protein